MTIKIERKEKPKRLSKKTEEEKVARPYWVYQCACSSHHALPCHRSCWWLLSCHEEHCNWVYTGALMCWTVVFTPIGTACGIVLSKIVDKSKAENSGPNGEGIKYAAAMASNFQKADEEDAGNSPPI